MKTTPATVEQISTYEHLMLELYNDADHNATIGYGHLVHMGPINGTEGEFTSGITKERALELLAHDVGWAEQTVMHQVTVPLNQNQFDALVSFTFNVGIGSEAHSTLIKQVNMGHVLLAGDEFLKWDHVNGVANLGLLRRRQAEQALFLKA